MKGDPCRLYPKDSRSVNRRSRDGRQPTIMTIDWREEICRFLNHSSDLTDVTILDELDTLSNELDALRRLNAQQVIEPEPPGYQIINRVICGVSHDDGLYLDVPWVVKSGSNQAHLRGSNKIQNFELHLERNKEVVFFVYREFECCRQGSSLTQHMEVKDFQIPKDICILNAQGRPNSHLEAFTATDWLDKANRCISGTRWIFEGSFEQMRKSFTIGQLPSSAAEFPIQDLSLYPARFAKNEDLDAIRRRGRMFWKCRYRNYVCYKDTKSDGAHTMSDPRFMIDTAVFRQMHPPTGGRERMTRDDLGPKVMSQDEPDLPDTFFMCLPTTLPGFNMQKKEWVTLEVGHVQEVTWNEEAFNLLVIDESTKELIQAVITNKLQAEDQADMISGKGNGLFILLHGGPGTGKTLTAESVAEIARKPLYRVTCGDIGTKAEDVEKYLEVVLLLGKTWGCVVLLDEADVFLEQRSLSNLERNALVSVFLRVLEYYDGILILTSNRVGTFDEAFRSRIQLTLRYENLTCTQRYTIWENFFRRLEKLENSRAAQLDCSSPTARSTSGFGFDFPDIRAHIAELADRNLNGREIRNAISTARQLAMYKREPMSYKHLERVIKETTKFEAYITELNRGFTSDEIAKDTGARL
ncbi:hypothetical protein NPX13_g1058 [Xylaria arbuscula]|uniref:AAA+ ATPase domain-containing protein n=1 Tax=Xylaria arbuscula TaxID=114810 RepID=A0A9W8NLS4_9PEZI|nr:hypothetical protein NPX13_g1058 [Xylaria arbuscula]